MNKVNKGLVVIIVILLIIVLCLGGYIVYDKVLKEDNNDVNNIEDVNQDDTNQNGDSVLNENEALQIVKDVTKKYFEYIHSLGPYCGELDWDDYISFGSYETNDFRDYNASKKFNSINEIREYYQSFMVENLFPKYLNDGVSYLEKDSKLYCKLSHKGCGNTYKEDASYYVIDSLNENTIVSSVILASETCGELYDKWEGKVTVVKDSAGNWLISGYNVEFSDLD